MVGNILNINLAVSISDKNVIQDIIRKDGTKISKETIIEAINHEYWKQWRKLLINSISPIIKCNKLGYFELRYKPAKAYIWKLLKKLRWNKERFPEKLPNDGTMIGQIQGAHLKALSIVWKQLNCEKKMHIERVKKINEGYRSRGQEHRIRNKY